MTEDYSTVQILNNPKREEPGFGDIPEDMKILFLVRQLGAGGAERQLSELAKAMHGRGIKVAVGLFYRHKRFVKITFENELRDAGVPVFSLEKKGRWDILGFLFRSIRLLVRERPDIIYGFSGSGTNILASLMRLLRPRASVVWSVRNSMIPPCESWLIWLMFRFEILLSKRCNLIIANSEAGKKVSVSRGIPREKIIVIPNGFDIDRFRPDREAGQALRSEWGCESGSKVLGIIARFDPVKDHPTFIRAASILRKKWPNLYFACVGGPISGKTYKYYEDVKKLVSELKLEDRVIWGGSREDMPAVYNAIDVLCSTSVSEGLSNVIGEAMATGVPCVVTDVGDSASIVGDAGVVVPPGDPVAIAAGCEQILNRLENEDNSISSIVRNRVVENYNSSQLADRTLNALGRLLFFSHQPQETYNAISTGSTEQM